MDRPTNSSKIIENSVAQELNSGTSDQSGSNRTGFLKLVDFIKSEVLKRKKMTVANGKISQVLKYQKQMEDELDQLKGFQINKSA